MKFIYFRNHVNNTNFKNISFALIIAKYFTYAFYRNIAEC